jgi:hypothetical protein
MCLAAPLLPRPAAAGPWNIEPRVGVSTDYSSNPQLRVVNPNAEEHIAAIVDLPLRYDTDGLEWLLRPSGRLSNSRGYSSLASNYEHVDAAAQILNERGSTTLQTGLARDTSLAYAGALVNGIGVRRDTASTGVDWTRFMSERTQIQLDASWVRVRYDEPANLNYLVDYRYLDAGPTVSVLVSERNTIKFLGNAARYQSLDGITQSTSENLEMGFVRQLSEILTLSTTAGYSRSKNTEKYYFGSFFLGNLTSNQDGAVYAATFTRQGQRLSVTGGVSRALQPTGFAYLSRQDSVNLTASYTRSERWDFALTGTWQRAINPLVSGREAVLFGRDQTARYLNVQTTVNWHWTPQWVLSMHATRVASQYGPPTVSGASTGVSLDLVRQFLRTEL